MPLNPKQKEEVKAAIAMSRKQALNFGLCLGKKPEGSIFHLHKTKNADVLMKAAKTDGETPKICAGTVETESTTMNLTVSKRPPAGMARGVRAFLAWLGLKLTVKIFDLEGNLLESDGEDAEQEADAATADEEDGAEAVEADDAPAGPDPLEGKWTAAREKFEPAVARLLEAGGDTGKLGPAWSKALALADGKSFADALKLLPVVKKLMEAAAANAAAAKPAGDSKLAKQWAAAHAKFEPLVLEVAKAGAGDSGKIKAAWAMAVEKAEGEDFAAALQILKKLAPILSAAKSSAKPGGGDQEAKETIREGAVDFAKAQLIWRQGRDKSAAEMRRLETAIVAKLEQIKPDYPDAADVFDDTIKEARELVARLDVFDDRLDDVLNDIMSAEQDGRPALIAKGRSLISDYRAALDSSFFAEVDEDNGFTPVAVSASLSSALAQIDQMMA